MAFKPTFANLLIRPFEEADRIGAIYIPDSAKHPLNQGEILKVGPSCNVGCAEDDGFKPGQIVIFNMHSESRVKVDNEMLFVVPVEQILLVMDPETFAKLQS